jgi:hypothetical protein
MWITPAALAAAAREEAPVAPAVAAVPVEVPAARVASVPVALASFAPCCSAGRSLA